MKDLIKDSVKPHFSDLTPEQQATFGNGCGLYSRFLRVPEFKFVASCRQHDFNFCRGGSFNDFIKANMDFFKAMLIDASNSDRPIFYSLMSYIYLLGVTVFGVFAFHWSKEYRTLEEILDYDALKKQVNMV